MPEYVLGFKDYYNAHKTAVGKPVTDEYPLWIPNAMGTPAFKMQAQVTEKGVLLYTPENGVTFIKATVPKPVTPPVVGGTEFHIADIRIQLPKANLQNLRQRALTQINMFIVHWDGGPNPGVYDGYDPIEHYKGEAQYHINKNWGSAADPAYGHGLMYHYKIDRKGNVYYTRNLQDIVWAANAANDRGLMVCVDATNGAMPEDVQIDALWRLGEYLFKERADLPNLISPNMYAHGELTEFGNSTDCPGARLRGFVKAYHE